MQIHRTAAAATLILAVLACALPATARERTPFRDPAYPTFTATLSNNTPLAFGMDAPEAARALQTPLTYVRGRPGNEIYRAIRTEGGSPFFDRYNPLFLQFRHGRLTGWKGDWGSDWLFH